MRLVLASQSPRRRQLISTLGLDVRLAQIDVDEAIEKTWRIEDTAENIANKKATAFDVSTLDADEVLVTADTVVVVDNKVIGKPKDREDAIRILEHLSGRKHTVYTGVCLVTPNRMSSFTEKTDVFFTSLKKKDIIEYVDLCKPFDRAGAYGIQDKIGMIGIERIEGCYYNVMGLPVARLYRELSAFADI